jgi:hypothetical protein
LFGLIVGGRDIGDTEEGKEIFLFRADEVGAERFGGLKIQRLFTDFLKLPDKTVFYFGG